MKPLIVALDVETEKEALQMTRRLSPWVDIFKVGPGALSQRRRPVLDKICANWAWRFFST